MGGAECWARFLPVGLSFARRVCVVVGCGWRYVRSGRAGWCWVRVLCMVWLLSSFAVFLRLGRAQGGLSSSWCAVWLFGLCVGSFGVVTCSGGLRFRRCGGSWWLCGRGAASLSAVVGWCWILVLGGRCAELWGGGFELVVCARGGVEVGVVRGVCEWSRSLVGVWAGGFMDRDSMWVELVGWDRSRCGLGG